METIDGEEFNPDQPVFVVFWTFRAKGTVEPRDIIGTLYSETKGFVGGDGGLETLIENDYVHGPPTVDLSHGDGKTEGRIYVQTKMGKERTAKLAAALETIDRIGPCDAEIEVERIKYTKGGRKQLVGLRARKMAQDEELWTTDLPLENKTEPKEVA